MSRTALRFRSSAPQAEQEHRIAGEAIEPRDDQLGPVATARLERTGEAWPVAMAFAALDLDDLLDELPVAAVKPIGHVLALRLEAEARRLLPLRRNPEIADVLAAVPCHRRGSRAAKAIATGQASPVLEACRRYGAKLIISRLDRVSPAIPVFLLSL